MPKSAADAIHLAERCPACRAPLLADLLEDPAGHWLVWCGNGPCTSKAANDGATAVLIDLAIDELRDKIYREQG